MGCGSSNPEVKDEEEKKSNINNSLNHIDSNNLSQISSKKNPSSLFKSSKADSSFFNRLKENEALRKIRNQNKYDDIDIYNEDLQNQREIEKRKKRIKKMPSLESEISFEHKEPEPEFDINKYKNLEINFDDENDENKPFKLGYEDEKYNGINYGKPIQIFNQTWLTFDVPVEPDVNKPKVEIPPGWRIPTLKDYEDLIKMAGSKEKAYVLLTHKNLLNMNKDFQYVTSNKVFDNEFNGYNKKSWIYYCVGFEQIDDDCIAENDNNDNNFIKTNNNITTNTNNNIATNNDFFSDFNDNDTIISEGNNNHKNNKKIKRNYKNTEFMLNMKNKLNDNLSHINKYSSKTPVYKSDLINENKHTKKTFDSNPFSIYLNTEKNPLETASNKTNSKKNNNNIEIINSNEKFIYSLNTFSLKPTLKCKLIANEVLDMTFDCPLVIERTYKAFFTVPPLHNITTFIWDFNDEYCDPSKRTSEKLKACHIFRKKGEYNVLLKITLFSNRNFHIYRKVWVIDPIEYFNEFKLNNISYGQPIKIGNQIWLDRDLTEIEDEESKRKINLIRGKGPGIHGENSYFDSVLACPKGWRLPYKEEVEELLNLSGRNNEQKIFFFSLLEGGFLADINESGFYDAICMNFKNEKIDERIKKDGNLNRNKKIEKNTDVHVDFDVINNNNNEINFNSNNFPQHVKNYNKILLSALNFGDVYNREAYSLSIENNKVFLGTRTTSMNSPFSMFSTRCILDENLDLDFGLTENSYPIGFEINFKVDYPNVTFIKWDFGDKSQKISNELSVSHSYRKVGEFELKVFVTLFDEFDYIVSKNINIYDDNINDSEKTELKSEDQILIFELGDLFKVKRIENVHFSHSIAPISPLLNTNGFYIAFFDLNDNKCKIYRILIEKNSSIKNTFKNPPIFSIENSIPFDICTTRKGFVLLLRDSYDENNLFITAVSHSGKILWRNNIMNNGPNPLKCQNNQLLFFNNQTEKIEFGMNSMFKPFSGRVIYGQKRILLIFSYMNNFGLFKGGEREDNSGDTIVSYSEDGTEVHLVQNWSTTHSLCQRGLYNGKDFFTLSLGDAGPANVKVLKIDPKIKMKLFRQSLNEKNKKIEDDEIFMNNKNINTIDIKYSNYFPLQGRVKNNIDLINAQNDFELENADYLKDLNNFKVSEHITMNFRHKYKFTNIISGAIPGNLKGKSSGRIGDFIKLNKNKLCLVYSRIPCIDGGEMNKENELSMIVFNEDLKIEKKFFFRTGDLINCIHNARYGNNIFVMISETKKKYGKFVRDCVEFEDEKIEEEHSVCNCFLVNNEGKNVSDLISYDLNIFSPSDDFKTLSCGSVLWAFSDDENNLNLCLLPTKKTRDLIGENDSVFAGDYCERYFQRKKEIEEERKKNQKEFFKNIGVLDEDEIKQKIKENKRIEMIEREKNEKVEEGN